MYVGAPGGTPSSGARVPHPDRRSGEVRTIMVKPRLTTLESNFIFRSKGPKGGTRAPDKNDLAIIVAEQPEKRYIRPG
ncbi:MAG TPA: hypothetical protein DCZ43_04585 [candidate division Zixibacteria bacterium]|nr:hypothetical protein [candidate division Zixibacteria bacterium]